MQAVIVHTLTVHTYVHSYFIYVVHMCTVPTVVLKCAYVCTEYTVGQLRKQNWDLRMSELCEIIHADMPAGMRKACTYCMYSVCVFMYSVCVCVCVFMYSTIVTMLHLSAM